MNELEKEYHKKHIEFWSEFFNNKEEVESFIDDKIVNESYIPKRMMNNVQRLCDLSDSMSIVKPDRKDLNIFFLIACIESLFVLANKNIKKQEMIIDFYKDYITDDYKRFIQDGIKISYISGYKDISIEEFALLLCSIRNLVVHEGRYWNIQFMLDDDKRSSMINIIPSKVTKDSSKNDVTYVIGLTYLDFRKITILGCINFINVYAKEIAQ